MKLIFDLDGTLIDSAPDIHATANAVLADEGLAGFDLATIRGFVGRGLPHLVDRILDAHGIADPQRAARMVEKMLARYESAVTLTRPYPFVPEALQTLRQAGHDMAVCTNKPLSPARAVLAHLRLDGFFDVVIGGVSGLPRKPDPAMLHEAARLLGDGRAVFIGDSEVDAETAASAGLPFLLFTEGYRKAPVDTLPHKAAFSDFALLPGLVATLG
ncbi:phosphoglycolate phosphatase [Paracoccus sediminicola]|uniref:phosphoglycolate phosphatase n=1 Tax=Paracoccus sediminicola TaxID=3017783 RepID=UPI0022F07DB7|nr:phosphoglycolate phosphatase [Paracoccus sediminicola]WBU56943.1 phosphoglycolate phosphatase [Paracoccus sediminicola]